MLHSAYKIAAFVGLLALPAISLAQEGRPRHVLDEAGFFSKDAITRANGTIDKIKSIDRHDLVIETKKEGPEKEQALKWARQRFNDLGVNGIYVLITDKYFRTVVGNNTLAKGYFTDANQKEMDEIIDKVFPKHHDEALIKTANFVLEKMHENIKNKAHPAPAPAPGHHNAPVHTGEPGGTLGFPSSIMSWLCIIVAVVAVMWVVIALIRAVSGGGGGYAGGGGGGYGGGGGGGFFSSMLGGLFGAAAGMWIYDSFFGGRSTSYGGGDSSGSGYQDKDTGAAAGGDDTDTDAGSSGGGDFDSGAGGGEAGGGGGDWGGGGDDAGGGGGDWGGGGGGDDLGGGGGGGGDW